MGLQIKIQILVISVVVFVFFAAVIVFSYFGRSADAKKRRLDYIKDSTNKNNPYYDLELSFFQRYMKIIVAKITKSVSGIGSSDRLQKNKAQNAIVERQLRLSGVFMSAQEFNSIKIFVSIIFLIIFIIAAIFIPVGFIYKFLIFLAGALLGVMGPTLFLRSKVRGHQQKIRDQLPDAMDLLGVCIEAGLSFDISLLKVAEKLKGPFIDELLIVHREMQMGRTRREALQNLAASTDIPELKTFTSALAQAEQLGIPIINVMRIQSAQLRVTRKQIAQEKGMKAPIKMMIPMIFFVFPVIFIILMGPTVINMIHQFSQ